ncbi:hypothetical protein F4782DRAFT_476904 [Xylaria castorea]|nr:hypothetical protein F4782DRAFT_476904 [Xylaria castorea]
MSSFVQICLIVFLQIIHTPHILCHLRLIFICNFWPKRVSNFHPLPSMMHPVPSMAHPVPSMAHPLPPMAHPLPSKAITKRKTLQSQAVIRRSVRIRQRRERNAVTTAPSPPISSVSADSGGKASPVSTSRASEGSSEAIQENSLSPRSADDPTGVLVANTSQGPIRFGGVFSDYDSNDAVSSSPAPVYFNRIPAFILLGLFGMLMAILLAYLLLPSTFLG